MKTLLQEYKHFFQFLACPVFIRKPTNKIKLNIIISLILILFPIAILLGLVTEAPIIKSFFCVGKDLMEEEFIKWGPLLSILVGSVLGPIIEEFLFRYYLNKLFGNLLYIFINTTILIYSFTELTTKQFLIYILLAAIMIYLINIFLKKNYASRRMIFQLFKKLFYLLFYLSALTFGLVHVGNYQICHNHSILIIFLVLPQLFAGLILGYARLKYGIFTSIILHSLNNFIAIGLMFLTK